MKRELIKRKGFTLAEVLITLGIIGVVAALTIPTLISNYQKTQTVTQLKKTFAVLSEAFQNSTIETENGTPSTWDWTQGITGLAQYMIPYLSTIKDCGCNVSSECKTPNHWLNQTNTYYSEVAVTCDVILKDGVVVSFAKNSATILDIMVDLNGAKKPNVVSKDIFFMRISQSMKKLYFVDANTDRDVAKDNELYGCNKTATSAGLFCGKLIQLDGWQIKDDYPW